VMEAVKRFFVIFWSERRISRQVVFVDVIMDSSLLTFGRIWG